MKYLNISNVEDIPTSHDAGKKKVLVPDGQIPHIRQFARVTLQAGETVILHKHEDFTEIYYFESGVGIMNVENKELDIIPGTCVVVEPNEMHGLTALLRDPLNFILTAVYTK